MTQLSLAELAAGRWRAWGCEWLLFTRCAGCGRQRVCRGKLRRRLLCLECYDLGGRPR